MGGRIYFHLTITSKKSVTLSQHSTTQLPIKLFVAVIFASQAGSSVIDYVLLSQQDFGCINDFRIDSFCEWSDHAPVFFNVLCNTEVFTPETTENGDPQIKWKDSLRDQFRRCLIARLADLNTVVNHIDVDDRTSVNSCVNRFSEI